MGVLGINGWVTLAVTGVGPPFVIGFLTTSGDLSGGVYLIVPPSVFVTLALAILFLIRGAGRLVARDGTRVHVTIVGLSIVGNEIFEGASEGLCSILLFLKQYFYPLFLNCSRFRVIIYEVFH